MNYIVLDLEWNQSTSKNKNKGLLFEIIEIGAVKLDSEFKVIGKYDQLISPTVHKKIHPIITDITKLSEVNLKHKPKFVDVIGKFLDWCGKEYGNDYIFCTYGSQDLTELQKNMIYHGVKVPWRYPFFYIDVQRVLSREIFKEDMQYSLEAAAKKLNIVCRGKFHRAYDDAYFTGQIMKNVGIEYFGTEDSYSLDYYCIPRNKKEEKEVNVESHKEFVSCVESDKETIVKRTDMLVTRCQECGKKCRKKILWFSDSGRYECIAKCKEHGYISGVINLKKYADDQYYGIKKVAMVDEEKYFAVVEKKQSIKEKRRQKRIKDKENSEYYYKDTAE